tara:strand:+ start:160 stop:366 length:207 start_codon:yes stop_codon:yes gene_type:complete
MATGPRKGKMKASPPAKNIAELREISPGVLVNPNYKKGKDPALDAVIDKLKKNPAGLDSSGMGNRWKV